MNIRTIVSGSVFMKRVIFLLAILTLITFVGCKVNTAGQAFLPVKEFGLNWVYCSDSDGGQFKNIFGAVTAQKQDGGSYYEEDSCIDDLTVHEQYCQGNEPRSINIECDSDMMCKDGSCVSLDNPLLEDPLDGHTIGENFGGAFVAGRFYQGLFLENQDILQYSSSYVDAHSGTILFWLKPQWDSDDGNQHLFMQIKGPESVDRNSIIIGKMDDSIPNVSNSFYFHIRDAEGNLYDIDKGKEWNAHEWHHFAGTWDSGGNMELFLDGESAGTRDDLIVPNGFGDIIAFGNNPGATNLPANAVFDEIKIFDSVLTESEIRSHMVETDPDVWKSIYGPPGGQVWDLVQSPYNSNKLYVYSRAGIHKSESDSPVERGDEWILLDGTGDYQDITSIAIYEDGIFFSDYSGIYYYEDGSIEQISDDWAALLYIHDDLLFAGGGRENLNDDEYLIKYTDLNQVVYEWHYIDPSIAELDYLEQPEGIPSRIVVPNIIAYQNRILANIVVLDDVSGEYSNGRLFVSEDFGDTWDIAGFDRLNPANPIDSRAIIANIIQYNDDPAHILVLLKNPIIHQFHLPISELIMESYDGGHSWDNFCEITDVMSNGVTDIDFIDSFSYLVNPYDSFILEVNSDREVSDFVDMPVIEGFEELNQHFTIGKLVVDPDNPNVIYGKTGNVWALGMLKSTEGVKNEIWEKMGYEVVASSPTIVVADPADPHTIYCSGNVIQETYFTDDMSVTWQPFSSIVAGDEVRINPHNTDQIMLADELSDIYLSNNGGVSFDPLHAGEEKEFTTAKIIDIEVAEDDPTKIFVSNFGIGISKANEDGRYWIMSGSSDYAYDFEIDPEDSDELFASYSPKIFEGFSKILKYSPDTVDNYGWKDMQIFQDSAGITSIEFDPSDANRMYTGVVGKRGTIFYTNTKDIEESWTTLNNALTFSTIHAMTIDPTDDAVVYACPWGDGIHITEDDGNTWNKIEGDSVPFSIASIQVHPQNRDIIYATDRTLPVLWASHDRGQTWSQVFDAGPDYLRLLALEMDPSNMDIIYISSFKKRTPMQGSVFKVDIPNGAGIDITNELPRTVLDIEVDHTNPDILYASTHWPAIYKSTDGGNSWFKTSYDQGGVTDILIDYEDANVLYAASGCGLLPEEMIPEGENQTNATCGIYRSTDQGITWDITLETVGVMKSLTKGHGFILGVGGDGVYVSRDDGVSWTDENTGLDFINSAQVAMGGSRIYVGTFGGGVYSSAHSNPLSWSKTEGPYPDIKNIKINIDSSNNNIIYATSYPGGVFKSTDRGNSWVESNFALPTFQVEDPITQGYYSLDIDPYNPQILYLGLFGKGVYKSEDGAATWTPMYGIDGQNSEIMEKGIVSIKADHTNEGELYLVANDGVYFSQDRGENWEERNNGLHTRDMKSLEISADGRMYVGTNGHGFYEYDRNAGSWNHMTDTLNGDFWTAWERRTYQFCSILFDPDVPGKVYLGHFPSGFFISDDNGNSWYDSSIGIGNDGIFSLSMNPYNYDIIWAGTYNGVAKSIDKGRTWELKGRDQYKEEEAWNSWEQCGEDCQIIPPEQWPYVIAIDSENTDTMYISTKNGRNKGFCDRNENPQSGHDKNHFCGIVMKSTDGGETWREIMDGLDWGLEYYTLLIYPLDNNILFLSSSSGVYISTNAGESWESINEGLPYTTNWVRENVADNLALTADNKYLLFGLMDAGVWKLNLDAFFNTR